MQNKKIDMNDEKIMQIFHGIYIGKCFNVCAYKMFVFIYGGTTSTMMVKTLVRSAPV